MAQRRSRVKKCYSGHLANSPDGFRRFRYGSPKVGYANYASQGVKILFRENKPSCFHAGMFERLAQQLVKAVIYHRCRRLGATNKATGVNCMISPFVSRLRSSGLSAGQKNRPRRERSGPASWQWGREPAAANLLPLRERSGDMDEIGKDVVQVLLTKYGDYGAGLHGFHYVKTESIVDKDVATSLKKASSIAFKKHNCTLINYDNFIILWAVGNIAVTK
jgi:hypothetical protein